MQDSDELELELLEDDEVLEVVEDPDEDCDGLEVGSLSFCERCQF